jgi:hypothetical protein
MPVSEQMPATVLRFGRPSGALAVPRSRHSVAASAAGAARFAAGPRGPGELQPLHPAPPPRPVPPAAPLRPRPLARLIAGTPGVLPPLRRRRHQVHRGGVRTRRGHPHPGLHGRPLELGPEAGTTVSTAARAVLVLRAFPVRLTARSDSGRDTLPVQVVMAAAATCATSPRNRFVHGFTSRFRGGARSWLICM